MIQLMMIAYIGVWIGFMNEFVWNFKKWADHYELQIRQQGMTMDQFCKWIAFRICLWPVYIKTLLNF